MKLLDKLPNIKKPAEEEVYLNRFAEYLSKKGIKKITIIDKPDETGSGRFDYLIELDCTKRVAVEIFRLFERIEERIMAMQWSNLASALENEIQKYARRQKKFKWSGVWRLEIPISAGASSSEAKNIAKKNVGIIINAMEINKKSVKINGFNVKLEKVGDHPKGEIYTAAFSEVRAINPPSQIESELRRLLKKKNEQLDTDKGEKCLVIVGKCIWAKQRETVEALSRINELWSMENFDKIYLEERPGHFIFIFSRELRNAWKGESFSVNNDFLFPFQRWVFRLREIDAEKTFGIITKIINNKKPYELFTDNHAREEIVKLGNWLIEQKRFKDALWLIEKFIDDPDPAEPEEFKGEPEFNYHQQIINGKDPLVITSVRGHLAWVIQKLALQKDYIVNAFKYTKELIRYNSLYAKLQAIFPLIEIAIRRKWLQEESPKYYQEFYNISFDLLKNYSRYPAIAKKITYIFFYFKDLTTKEALDVLEKLQVTSESAGLFVYFAIFRERYYKNPDGTDKRGFDPKPLRQKLEEVIKNNDDKYLSLREKIAWNFLSILNEYPEEFKIVSPYIDLFLQQPYDSAIYRYIEIIIEKFVDKEPDLSIRWFDQVLKNLTEYTETHEEDARKIALRTEEIIKVVAVKKPEKLIDLMQLLNFLWEKGSYIGRLKILFESFKLVTNEDLKLKVKKKFIELYSSMKKLYPRLENVDWD